MTLASAAATSALPSFAPALRLSLSLFSDNCDRRATTPSCGKRFSSMWTCCPKMCVLTQRSPHTSHLTPHTSHLTPHTSHLTPHTSHLTPHTSHRTHASHHVPKHAIASGPHFGRKRRQWSLCSAAGGVQAVPRRCHCARMTLLPDGDAGTSSAFSLSVA
jgi:hypothetical protein